MHTGTSPKPERSQAVKTKTFKGSCSSNYDLFFSSALRIDRFFNQGQWEASEPSRDKSYKTKLGTVGMKGNKHTEAFTQTQTYIPTHTHIH